MIFQNSQLDFNYVAAFYESIIIILAFIILILSYQKYLVKKNKPTLYLFLVFFNMTISIMFSIISKIFALTGFLSTIDPYTPIGWICFRIRDLRISEAFVVLAIFFSYLVRNEVLEEKDHPIRKHITVYYGLFTLFYVLIIYDPGNVLLDILAFLFVFGFMLIVYLPLMITTIKIYNSLEETALKKAFISLTIMSFSFMMIFFCFLIDRIYYMMGYIFSPFYFIGWLFLLIGITGAYYGYIRH